MRPLSKIEKTATTDEIIDQHNELIDSFNFLATRISMSENFDGQIIENISFGAGEDKVINHNLGKTPLFRFILRQEGNGVLSDTPSGWNDFQVQIKNNGAVSVTATIMLLRE
jgi:hypothetical protein